MAIHGPLSFLEISSSHTAETRPRFHQLPTLLKQIAPAVGRLDLALERARPRPPHAPAQKIGPLGPPPAKGRPEAVRGQAPPAHAFENRQHRHVRERPGLFAAWKDEVAFADPVHLLEDAVPVSGTR